MRDIFRREAKRRGIPYLSVSPVTMVHAGSLLADDRARELVAAGQLAEGRKELRDDVNEAEYEC